MIEYTSDIELINKFLENFNTSINESGIFSKYIIYKEEDVLGILCFQFIYDRIEIDYLYVQEEYRNKGIATKMLDELVKFSVENKGLNITLEVRESNIAAINFYKKNLFKEVSSRENYYKDENGILMMRELDL